MSLYQSILNDLLINEEAISGQTLAKKYNVSRNSIWKNIQKLQSEGFEILSTPNVGYKIQNLPTSIHPKLLDYYLDNVWSNLAVEYYDIVESTNDLAKVSSVKERNQPKLIIANKQNKGRGRQGRTFYSDLEYGIYMSLLIYPEQRNSKFLYHYTTMAALAVVEALSPFVDDSIAIKWVNDIFYRNKKVGGILCEAITDMESADTTSLCIGIGLNLAGDFKDAEVDIKEVAGVLFESYQIKIINQNHLIKKIIQRIYDYEQQFPKTDYLENYSSYLLGKGENVTYKLNDQLESGIIKDINNSGQLLIEKDGEIIELSHQEISFSSKQFVRNNRLLSK